MTKHALALNHWMELNGPMADRHETGPVRNLQGLGLFMTVEHVPKLVNRQVVRHMQPSPGGLTPSMAEMHT